jgi:hypothetical protein
VNLLADKFPCFQDEGTFEKKKVRFLKRAQIFVADLWAAFDGKDYGEFNDIDKITMFAGMLTLVLPWRSTKVGNRLPHPANASLFRRAVVLPATGEQNKAARNHRFWPPVGDADAR